MFNFDINKLLSIFYVMMILQFFFSESLFLRHAEAFMYQTMLSGTSFKIIWGGEVGGTGEPKLPEVENFLS